MKINDMNESKPRKTLKIFICILIAFLLFVTACFAYTLYGWGAFKFNRDEALIPRFYKEPANSIDGVFIGSSAFYRYWMAPEAFDENGITVYTKGFRSMPLRITPFLIADVLNYQNPKFIALDLRSAVKDPEIYKSHHVKNVTTYMPNNLNRLKVIAEFMAIDIEQDTEMSKAPRTYSFPEDRGNADYVKDQIQLRSMYKGSIPYGHTMTSPLTSPLITTDTAPLMPELENDLHELLDYLDTVDCEFVFISTPYRINEDKNKRLNCAKEIIKERGYPVIDMNTEEVYQAMKLDFGTDFYNANHTNLLGAFKTTHYLADKLDFMYDLEDHRGDKNYASWQKSARLLQERYDSFESN